MNVEFQRAHRQLRRKHNDGVSIVKFFHFVSWQYEIQRADLQRPDPYWFIKYHKQGRIRRAATISLSISVHKDMSHVVPSMDIFRTNLIGCSLIAVCMKP